MPRSQRVRHGVIVVLALSLIGLSISRIGALDPQRLVIRQTPPSRPPSAAISGVVVDAVTNTPIPGALVELSLDRTSRARLRQLTDPKGRYVFAELPASDHAVVRATRFGYLDGGFGSGAASSGGFFTLADGEWIRDVRIALRRPAAITGTVFDERGEPVTGVLVRVLAMVRVDDHDELAAGPLTTTDERGRYVIGGLPPGRYLVQVPSSQSSGPLTDTAPRSGRFPVPPPAEHGHLRTYPPTFSPGAPTAETAQAVDVTFGDRRDGTDVRLTPVDAFTVSGTLDGPPGSWTGASARLVPAGGDRLAYGSEAARSPIDARGGFTFVNVAAGAYVVQVARGAGEFTLNLDAIVSNPFPVRMPGSPGSMSRDVPFGPPGLWFKMEGAASEYWGREPVVVSGGDVAGAIVRMRRAGVLDGRVDAEMVPGAPVPLAPPAATLQLEPADASPALGTSRTGARPDSSDDRFTIRGLLPGKYLLRTTGWDHFGWDNAGWLVKSITWNGREYTELPFDAEETQDFHDVHVVLTNAGATVSGVVTDDHAQRLDDVEVVLFPARAERWQNTGLWPSTMRSTAVSNRGEFEIPLVPAGDYAIAAIRRAVRRDGLSPELFGAIRSSATPVSVSWGETRHVTLEVVDKR